MFITLDTNGSAMTEEPLTDLPFTWQNCVNEKSLILGWQDVSTIFGSTNRVSANTCSAPCPSGLTAALKMSIQINTFGVTSMMRSMMAYESLIPLKKSI
jgi:hypothetical protein